MKKLKQKLSRMESKKIIDIATRDGAFIKQLSDNLAYYEEIIGIDISDKGFIDAQLQFEGNNKVRFEERDAYATGFTDNYFDLVCISNSLHHIEDIPKLLKEMTRIKKEDGLIIISEITSDGQIGSSLTHALIHDLDCMVDTYCGIYHHRTYSHKEISEYVTEMGLIIIDDFDDVEISQYKNELLEARIGKARIKVDNFKDTVHYDKLYDMLIKIIGNYKNHGVSPAVQYIIFAT